MNLFQWINTPGAITEYRRWQNDPITQIMIDGIRDMNRSARLPSPSGEAALQELGFRAARDNDLIIMEKLDEFAETVENHDEARRSHLSYLVNNEGWTLDEAKQIVKQQEM